MTLKKIAFLIVDAKTSSDVENTLISLNEQEIKEETQLIVLTNTMDEEVNKSLVDKMSSTKLTISFVEQMAGSTTAQKDTLKDLVNLKHNIPEGADWVWLLKAGDRLYSKFAVQQVVSAINQNAIKELKFVHASNSERSFDTGHHEILSVEDLCDKFGFFDILGPFSSLLIERSHFDFAFGPHFENRIFDNEVSNIVSPATHSAFLFVALNNRNGLLFDKKIIVPQDDFLGLSDENLDAGSVFAAANDLIDMATALEGQKMWSAHFFRTYRKSLWSELVYRLGDYFDTLEDDIDISDKEFVDFIELWQVVLSLADYLNDEELREIVVTLVASGIRHSIEFIQQETRDKTMLEDFFLEQSEGSQVYPATLVRPDQLMEIMKESA